MKNEIEGFRLSPQQRDLWRLAGRGDDAVYRVWCAAWIDGTLDHGALAEALRQVISRHEILRTRICAISGLELPLLIITEAHETPYERRALQAQGTEQDREIAEILANWVAAPVDLERGPLLRALLLEAAPQCHLLALSAPALLSDPQGLGNALREIAETYSAGATASGLDEPPQQYVDVSEVLNDLLAHEQAEAGRAHWRRRPLPAPAGLRLPFEAELDGEMPPFQPARVDVVLRPGAAAAGVAPEDFLLACWLLLLGHLTGSSEVVVGTVFACRDYEGLNRAVGLYRKVLPFRAELDPTSRLEDFLRYVRETREECVEWQDYFSWKLVEEGPGSKASFLPFGFELEADGPELPAGFSLAGRGFCGDRFKVLLAGVPHAGGEIGAALHYDTSFLSRAQAERLAASLAALVGGAADPGMRLGDLPWIGAEERQRLVVELNATEPREAGGASVLDLFARQVESSPEAVAVVFEEERLTYRDLDVRSDRLAAFLAWLGAGPESRVGVCLERSLEMLSALLGVLKAGAAYVPLEPGHPAERLRLTLEDAGVTIVLTEERLAERLPATGVRVVRLDADSAEIATAGSRALRRPIDGRQLAYVLYTSGSTGRPKGVMVTHSSLANYLLWCQEAYGLDGGCGALVHSPIGFDLTVTSLFAPLLAGRAVLFCPEGWGIEPLVQGLQSGDELALLKLTPAHLELLGAALADGALTRGAGTLIVGGEQLLGEAVRPWVRRHPASRVVNEYGPTEAVVGCCVHVVGEEDLTGPVPIGRPITGARIYLLDESLQPVAAGVPGELYLGGVCLARGYQGAPALTAGKFVPDPVSGRPGERLYRTGDLARHRLDGTLEFLGRLDHQVKVRGFRVELGEIEAILGQHPAVRAAAVILREDTPGEPRLTAYVAGKEVSAAALQAFLRERLAEYMVPAAIVFLDVLPLTTNGKVDRKALPAPGAASHEASRYVAPRTAVERAIGEVWRDILQIKRVGLNDNFFDLGGHSFLVAKVHRRLREALGREISMIDLFRYPTVRSLADFLSGGAAGSRNEAEPAETTVAGEGREIAIIGLSGRFPQAADLEEFWRNLRDGVEAVTFFTDDELLAAGVDPELVHRPDYVKAKAMIEGSELFDAAFFGFSPREAEVTDPQHRLFLEHAWQALENAGYDSARYPGRIGVLAGLSMNTYWPNLQSNPAVLESTGGLQLLVGNDKDFLPTRVAYKLDLRGPALAVQTACSTSLVCVHLACRSLQNGEADMALAGGVSVRLPQINGYLFQEGGIASPDGHCRAFDARARGTIGGNGVGVVVLKRLADALADGDTIHAVIRGSAINNDGSAKIGYTAPSIEGQARVIAAAQAAAGISPESVTYVETHGTGTVLGDPIEVAALSQVFRSCTADTGFCAIGSVKTNVGHLDAAAGVTGLLKTVLALKHGEIPPSLNFEQANPEIDFAGSPFYVNTSLAEWSRSRGPRRAGVSAFGIGGTNAHVVLEEPPALRPSSPSRPWQLLVLSARTPTALEAATDRLAAELRRCPDLCLPDLAHTLQVGRRAFDYRRILVCRDAADALLVLGRSSPERIFSGLHNRSDRAITFLFPGQGTQYPRMGVELYATEPTFREYLDRCCELLLPHLGHDLREILFPADDRVVESAEILQQTAIAQPALFAFEYALARLWMEWGVRPEALIGHSLGEYVAACLAGVFSLGDGLALVAARGRLMQDLPGGAMLGVPLAPGEVMPLLGESLSLAAVNAPQRSVVSGPVEEIEDLQVRLAADGFECRRLRVSHAFHSAMMDAILEPIRERFVAIELREPALPFVSNLTGTWITAAQALDPGYWLLHLREAVRFSAGIEELLRDPDRIFLEVGPGRTLSSLVQAHPGRTPDHLVLASLPHPQDGHPVGAQLLESLGRLWLAGVVPDWARFYRYESRRRIPAPTYPFERQRYWVDRQSGPTAARSLGRKMDATDWFYLPSWRKTLPARAEPAGGCVLVFEDGSEFSARTLARLEETGHEVVVVRPGDRFARVAEGCYTLSPGERADYDALMEALWETSPERILHLWSVTLAGAAEPAEALLERGLYSVLFLAQALANGARCPARLVVVSNGMQAVAGESHLEPAKAAVLGICRNISCELPGLSCRSVDIALPDGGEPVNREQIDQLLAELDTAAPDAEVAYRGPDRWVPALEPVRLERRDGPSARLRRGGVYLLTGGLGGVGLEIARFLVETVQARLVLVGRSPLPLREGQLRRLRALEQQGAELMIRSADVSDLGQMRAVVEEACRRLGAIHGVVHAAGVPGGGLIPLATRESVEVALAAKVRGTLVLDALFAGTDLDFLVLCSSLKTVLPRPGSMNYCAANAFLDAFAQARRRRGRFTVAIAWDTWREAGMAVDEAARLEIDPAVVNSTGLTSAEGVDVFARALDGRSSHLFVSTRDLPMLVALNREQSAARLREATELKATPTVHARPDLRSGYLAPRNESERLLAEIWQGLLGIDRAGVHDNFFELGGDSVISIQLTARANRAGLRLTPKQVFENQTIAALAAVIGSAEETVAEQGLVSGPVPLTPIQRWFFEQNLAGPHHWNQAILFEAGQELRPDVLAGVVTALLAHHDALRLTFPAGGEAPAHLSPAVVPVPLTVVDLSELPDAAAAVQAGVAQAQASLDLASGPLLRAVNFRMGHGAPGRLLLVLHHLVVDAVSWRILLQDLETAHRQISAGETVALPPKTTSFKQWAERLAEHARSDATRRELALWSEWAQVEVAPLPLDILGGDNTEGSLQRVVVSLSVEETQTLLRAAPGVFRAKVDEVILAALTETLVSWIGGDTVRVTLERHGREPLFDDVDLSRTVGWFTALCPLLLDLGGIDGPESLVREVKERVRQVPHGGIGFGLLHYLDGGALAPAAHPEVSFLYLGQLDGERDQPAEGSAGFAPASEPAGPNRCPLARRAHVLDITGRIERQQLQIGWNYSAGLHRRETIERLARRFVQRLRSLLAVSRPTGAEVFAPSDFPLASLDRQTLGHLAATLDSIEDIYRLSPLQRGLLFHTLHHPESGVYVQQLTGTLHGDLDAETFEHAWRRTLERNPVLRTSFHWEGLEEPLQVVHREAAFAIGREDWRELDAAAQEEQLAAYLRRDRQQGFALDRAPLMRVALIHVGDGVHRFLWSHHHLLLDGWSIQHVLQEVLSVYRACGQGLDPALDPRPPYRDYIAWLAGRDLRAAESFWRPLLQGAEQPTPLPLRVAAGAAGEPLFEERRRRLPVERTAALRALARRQKLTLNTLVQGAWILLLSHLSGVRDVLFGAVVSGRPADLPQVESMIGLFINTLPVRAEVPAEAGLLDWLAALQERHVDMRQHEHTPLVEIQAWTRIPRSLPLFESIFVFESFPVQEAKPEQAGQLEVRQLKSLVQESYPLIVEAMPRNDLLLGVRFDRSRIDPMLAEQIVERLAALLEEVVARPEARLGELESWLAETDRRELSQRAREFSEADRSALGRLKRRAAARTQA